jgi:hypothetical protein
MCNYDLVIDAYVFPCDPEISRERIANDLSSDVKRADSVQFINEQYKQYLATLVALEKIETDFYRTVNQFGHK